MNDITGADIRCPNCKITSLTPYFVGNSLHLVCACGYGKEKYYNALEIQKAREKMQKNGFNKKKSFFDKIHPLFRNR